MKRLTVRQFRSTFAQLEEPVEVGEGLWIPDRSKAAAVLRELVGELVDTPDTVATVSIHVDTDAEGITRLVRANLLARQEARDRILRAMPTTKRPGKG